MRLIVHPYPLSSIIHVTVIKNLYPILLEKFGMIISTGIFTWLWPIMNILKCMLTIFSCQFLFSSYVLIITFHTFRAYGSMVCQSLWLKDLSSIFFVSFFHFCRLVIFKNSIDPVACNLISCFCFPFDLRWRTIEEIHRMNRKTFIER